MVSKKFPHQSGFTLIELLIVIAILGILASAILIAMNPAKRVGQARDAQRKGDLNQLAGVVEAYFIDHSEYPNSGILETRSYCWAWNGNDSDWIPNLVPSYVKALPQDPLRGDFRGNMAHKGTGNPIDNGQYVYCYTYRSDGTDYKLAAQCGAEEKEVNAGDPFYKGSEPVPPWSCGNWHFAIYSPGAKSW